MKKIVALCFFVCAFVAVSAFAQQTKVVVIPLSGSACGKGVLNSEEVDPPISQFSTLNVSPDTCRYDLSKVPQLYCNGSWSWAGPTGCDQADADIFCQLRTGNPAAIASSFTTGIATAEPGFPGTGALSPATAFTADLTGRLNTPLGFDIRYQNTSILADHGQGTVINSVTCTIP